MGIQSSGISPEGPEKRRNREAVAAGAPRRHSTEQILRAAETLFAHYGFGGTTMAAIAEAADLPKANLQYYFSKEQLYRAVLEGILSKWLQDADVWITRERTPLEGITGYVRAKMEWTRTRGDASRIFAGELLAGGKQIRRFLEIEVKDYVEKMDVVFRHWAATGQMRSISGAHFLFCIWAMTQSYADFSPQMEAVLGREDGLTVRDHDDGTITILQLVLGGLMFNSPSHG